MPELEIEDVTKSFCGIGLDSITQKETADVNVDLKGGVEVWAVTISPPRTSIKWDVFTVLILLPFKEYILNGQLVLFPEFTSDGRLHYHGYFKPSQEDYGNDYFFWSTKIGKFSHYIELSKVSGVTKRTHVPKYKKVLKGFLRMQLCCRFRDTRDKEKDNVNVNLKDWLSYCFKGEDFTRKCIKDWYQITPKWYRDMYHEVVKVSYKVSGSDFTD